MFIQEVRLRKMNDTLKCVITEGRFLIPCRLLSKILKNYFLTIRKYILLHGM